MSRQAIIGTIQEGRCADIAETNPYVHEDQKKRLAWEYGHESTVKEHQQQQRHDSLSVWRKLLCKVGLHKYNLKRVPGRPHIKDNEIVGRDPIINKYTCIYCPATYFVGLNSKRRNPMTTQKQEIIEGAEA